MNAWLLALDFGGTKHSAALIAVEDLQIRREPGELAWRGHRRLFSPPGANARSDIQAMFTMANELLNGATPVAIGVSFGGLVDEQSGTVRLSHHVPGWESTPLKELLEAEFRAPTRVDNDANVAALGEHRFGAGRGQDSLLYITVSTGVGGGWILNNLPWRGSDGMAGEIGHMVVDPQGPRCLCGKLGCLERLASGPYIAQNARELLQTQPVSGAILRHLINDDPNALNGQIISQAAALGDPLAWQALEKAAWALGVAIGNAANLVNPRRFVLGGGVTKSGKAFWDTLQHTAHQTALPEIHFDVLPAALGDDAPLWGAIALVEDYFPVR